MKIVRGGGGPRERERTDALSFHGNYMVLILQKAVDQQKLLVHDEHTILHEKLRSDDRIGDACFVLKAKEDEALCGAGALPRNYAARNADACSIGEIAKIDRRAHALALQRGAMMSQGMKSYGEACASKIGEEALFGSH